VAAGHRADAVDAGAVRHDEQVIVGARLGVRARSGDIGHELVERRDRVGEDRRRLAAAGHDEPPDRERRADRVRVGVLMTDGEHAPGGPDPIDDRVRDGRRPGREVDHF